MSVDVLGYLAGKGLQTKRAGGDEVHCACPFCGEDEGKRGRLYVNTDPNAEIPGLHMCHLCGAKGSLVSLKRFYGDTNDEAVDNDADHQRLAILRDAAAYYHERLTENATAFDWLRTKRGLALQTIVDHQLGWADGGLYVHLRDLGYRTVDLLGTGLLSEDRRQNRVTDALRDMVTIPYHTAGNVTLIRGRTFPYKGDGYATEVEGPKYKTPAHQKARLFNSAATWDADELIVTEGEFDALVLTQAGFAAVGVPGANAWQDAWDGYMTDIKRIYVVFDRDSAGVEGAKKLKDRFGPRVRNVEMPLAEPGKPKNDPTQWVAGLGHSAGDFRELLEAADSSGLLITVDQAAAEHASIQNAQGIEFGIDELDGALRPGFLPGQVMVVLAKSGTGKTIGLLNMFQTMAFAQPDLKFLFVSLEQTRGEWFERARRIFRFYNLFADDEDCLDFWRDRLMLVDKNRLSQVDLHSILDDYEYRMGRLPDVVGIDYLGYLAQGFKGDRYERTSDAVMAVKGIAKDRRIRMIVPHQVSRVARYGQEPEADAARDAGVVEETADYVLILWSADHAPSSNTGAKDEEHRSGIINLRVGKSRHGGRGLKVLMQFAPLSLALVPHMDASPLNPRRLYLARNELIYAARAEDWQTAHLRHRGELEEEVDRPGAPPPPAHTQQTRMKGVR